MADLNSLIGSVSKGAGTTVTWAIIIIGVIALILIVFGLIAWWYFSKKRWNLRVEFKIPRSDGRITFGEWGKGMFDSKRGVIYLKRAKMRTVPMKIIDIRKYLQGTDLLTVIQLGAEDFRPVLNDSWMEHVIQYEDEEGNTVEQKEAIMNIKIDTGINKAWKSAWDSAAKKAYSLQSFLQQFQTPIAIAIVVIAVFVGFAIIWTRLPSVCGG